MLKNDDLIVVDLFCGAGGFSQGAHLSGRTTVALAVDSDPHMLSLHHFNFPGAKHVLASLGGDKDEFVAALLAFVDGRPWHLHGSPPCQSFSIANRSGGHQTGGDDERSNLTFWFLEVVALVTAATAPNPPASWSMEQVPTALKQIRRAFPHLNPEADEYDAAVQQRVVYGWEFGAPTLRKRVFLGEGWTLTPAFRKQKKRKRAREPVQTLPTPSHPDLGIPWVLAEFGLSASMVAIRGTRNYDYRNIKKGETKNRKVDSPGGAGLRTFEVECYAMVASQSLSVWTKDGPMRADGTIEWRKRRAMTPDEAKRIQGFPDSYTIEVTKTSLVAYESIAAQEPLPVVERTICEGHKIRAIGNAVIPRIAYELFIQ
jgi:site-specific DNA-cytosine methylase